MSILEELGGEAGYLKAGILGFGGSGKTHTAVELAIGVREFFGCDKPIGFADTESGSDYIGSEILRRTGRRALGKKTRAFSDLMAIAREAEERCSVLIVDSATHFWRELLDSYMRTVNARLQELASTQRRPFVERRSMEPSDFGIVNAAWFQFADWFLNARLHVIVCGRAGYEYADREDEEGNLESVKVGIKMRTGGEFSYEPALLVEMERIQRFEGNHTFLHRATVIKDKFHGCLDGKSMEDPTFAFFEPHVARLMPAAHSPVDMTVKTSHGVLGGDRDWHREKQTRTILAEEIDGELERAHPGQTMVAKQARQELLHRVFGTYSKTAIAESTHSDRLRRGLEELRAILRPPAPSATGSTDPQDQIPDFADSSGDAAPPVTAAPPAQGPAADAPPPPAQTAAAPEGETKPKRARRTSKPSAPAAPAPAAAPAQPEQTSLAVDLPVGRLADEIDVADVREIEQTIARLGEDPSWQEAVTDRIRRLPDGMLKARLWGLLQDAKRDLMLAQAKTDAAARVENRRWTDEPA